MTTPDSKRPPAPDPTVRSLASNETIVRANGVDLCTQTFGDPADPAILLVHGATASMLAWDERFCQRLAAGSRFVIRYDHRDTGRSVSYEPGAPGYAFLDLTADTIGLLDALGVKRAHFMGTSMGGGIVMQAALDYPDRVASLILHATTTGRPGLQPMSEAFLSHIRSPGPDWSDRDAVIDRIMAMLRIVSNGSGRLDEALMREDVGRDVDRTVNVASSQVNHFVMDVGGASGAELGEIQTPTLVIHGDIDPIFPLAHAHALQQTIPGAQVVVLERTGHELPPSVWDVVVPAIIQHTSGEGTASTGSEDTSMHGLGHD